MEHSNKILLFEKIRGLAGLAASLGAILGLATAFCALAAGAIFALGFFLPKGASPADMLQSALNGGGAGDLATLNLAASFLIYAGLGAAVLVIARVLGGPKWRDRIAWRPWSLFRRQPSVWLICAAALAYSFAADFLFSYVDPTSAAWLKMPKNFAAAAAVWALAVGFAPVVEELVFRGWIFTSLRLNFGFATALLVSSGAFAALHYESTHLYALAVFPVGLALGAIREITGTIKSTIAFHAFNNFLACALSLLNAG